MRYLDTAATSPVRPEVLQAMWEVLAGPPGNPSSRHELGMRASRTLEDARARVAAALGARPGEIVFTASGTEGDNLAVRGIALASRRGRHIVTTPLEHDAVLGSCDALARLHGAHVTILPVDGDGLVDPRDLHSAIRDDTALVSIQHASNEIGTVQPIAALAEVARGRGVPLHTDAVQSAGWLPVHRVELGADAVTIAGHKLGTPVGIGAVVLRSGLRVEPLLHGGGQERGRRSGTENVAGAVGLATALELVASDTARGARTAAVRDAVIEGVEREIPGAFLTGARSSRLPFHASFCFPGVAGEPLLLELERRGIACSSGSACAAGEDEPSAALLALGIAPDVAQSAIRLTLVGSETPDDALAIVGAVRDSVAALRTLV